MDKTSHIYQFKEVLLLEMSGIFTIFVWYLRKAEKIAFSRKVFNGK